MQDPPDKFSITMHRPHVVLLGAGASLAAFPNGDKYGRRLPLMDDFVEVVYGLADYLDYLGINYKNKNFEIIYSELYDKYRVSEALQDIEEIVYTYFSRMELPDDPTLYDHLVLSLRGEDIIATFNWDPFLWQALSRNHKRVGIDNLPKYLFLHGNTGVSVCTMHEIISVGHRNNQCNQCGAILQKNKLLFPITHKDYTADPFINTGWKMMKSYLKAAYMFTIFGYSAPKSDIEAISLLQEGWGNAEERELEQIQIIDIMDIETIESKWQSFFCRQHYNIYNSFYNTFIGKYARRSCDALWDAVMMCNPREEYPVLKDATWEELDIWLKPMLDVENRKRESA